MNTPTYILLNRDSIQRMVGSLYGHVGKVWPVAESHEDALGLIRWLKAPHLRADRIGSIPGETFEAHVKAAIEEGCFACCCVCGWNLDGTPKWKTMLFHNPIEPRGTAAPSGGEASRPPSSTQSSQ